METMLPKQPEDYSDLIAKSLRLYRLSFKKIAIFAFLVSAIVLMPRFVSIYWGEDIWSVVPPLSPKRLWIVLLDLAALMFFIAIIWHMFCVIRNKHEPFIEDIQVGAKKAWLVFLAAILQSAIVFGFSMLCYGVLILLAHFNILFQNSMMGLLLTGLIFFALLAFFLYLSVLFVFLIPLIAIENRNVVSALQTSILLVWNHWWRVFSTQLTPWFYYFVSLVVVKYILGVNLHIYMTEYAGFEVLPAVIQWVLLGLFIPWVAAILLVQLKDLELRNHLVPKNKQHL